MGRGSYVTIKIIKNKNIKNICCCCLWWEPVPFLNGSGDEWKLSVLCAALTVAVGAAGRGLDAADDLNGSGCSLLGSTSLWVVAVHLPHWWCRRNVFLFVQNVPGGPPWWSNTFSSLFRMSLDLHTDDADTTFSSLSRLYLDFRTDIRPDITVLVGWA